MFVATTATKKVLALKKRVRAAQGGTSASKTISILLVLIHLAQSDKTTSLTSVVAESIPHLKRGAMRDFKNILESQGYWKDSNWNVVDSTYTFETGSKIEFFSADAGDKLRGARRDRLFINECNNIHYEAFNQLEVRTRECVYLDWNPSGEFWFYTDVKPRDDVEHIILTYKDNEALDQSIVDAIEKRKVNASWWKVYGEGQLGEVEARIYKDWQIIDEIPHQARLERRGLDFGYSQDPVAIVDIYKYDGGLILDELCYSTGLPNREIAEVIKNAKEPSTLVMADSAEPKSIDELKTYNINVLPAQKGPGSVNQGIQFIQDQRISVTKRSLNILKEYRNYLWLTDKNGIITPNPSDFQNHAMDAIRYGLSGMHLDTQTIPKQKRQYKPLTRYG